MDSGPYDLLVSDSGTGRDVAFEFKAKVKGQNRRTDVGPIANAILEVLVPAMQQLRDELGIRRPVARPASRVQKSSGPPATGDRDGPHLTTPRSAG